MFVDAHFHIIDPRFPVAPSQGYAPEPFTVADYRATTRDLGVVGGVVVAGSFQHGHAGLLAALEQLEGFAGVAHLDPRTSDDEIRRLDAAGIRAIRINAYRGSRAALDGLDALARRVHDLAGWHVELYASGEDLAHLEPRLRTLPKLVVDHLGMSSAGTTALCRLAERGAGVKASGFGRVDLDVPATLRAVHAANPRSLMAGTDLPSTRARRPFRTADLDCIAETLGFDAARAVLHDNARDFYAR